MDLLKIALGLAEQFPLALGDQAEFLAREIEEHQERTSDSAAYISTLFEMRAGLTPMATGTHDDLRLGSPRLRTTYPDERRRALTKRMLDQAEVLAKQLGPVVKAALHFEFAKLELEEERARDQQFKDAEHARRELGVYVEVVEFINRLFADYGVTRRHYPCLTDEQVRDIAAILLRQSPDDVPVKTRRARGGAHG